MPKIDVIEINGEAIEARRPKAAALEINEPVAQPELTKVTQRLPKRLKPHRPQPSSTLMRRAVKKPVSLIEGPLEPLSQAVVSPPEQINLAEPKNDRLSRAQAAQRSSLISHFEASLVQPAYKPAEPAPPEPPPLKVELPETKTSPEPSRQETAASYINQVLETANAHEARPPRKRTKRSTKLIAGAGSALVVGLLCLIGLSHLSTLKLEVASARAAISPSLNSRLPAGYSLSSLAYGAGNIAAHFNTSTGSYSLTEEKVPYTDQDVVSNLQAQNITYSVVSMGGQTVYLSGQNSATWLKDHVLFTLNNNQGLSFSQLKEVVASL